MKINKYLKELKILIVEDEPKLASLLKDTINTYCYSVITAHDGNEGLRKYLKVKPDIIITDIMMPNLDGLEMTLKIKEKDSNVPIIVLSAFGDQEKLLKAIDVGINKYFIKPFDPDELLEYIVSISGKLKNDLIILEDDFKFNKETNNLYKDDKYIALTKRESILLQLLIKNPKDMITNDLINKELWNDGSSSEERLRTFIKRFRVKTSKKLINNIKGQGYQLVLV